MPAFGADEFVKGKLPSIADIQNLLHFPEEEIKVKAHKRRGKQQMHDPSSESSDSESESGI